MFPAIPIEEFRQRIRGDLSIGDWRAARHIVSLRELVAVEAVEPMRREYLAALVRSVPLTDATRSLAYAESTIETMRVDPHSVSLGQTFVERGKYQRLLETFETLFEPFCLPRGVVNLPACIVLGRTQSGSRAIAHYLPPLIERRKKNLALLDGVHRMFLGRQIGSTLECVVVSAVGAAFPVSLHGWDKVSVVSQKPPLEERYSNLDPQLFRDLKYIGVDG